MVDHILPHFPHRRDPKAILDKFFAALSPLPQSVVDDLTPLDPPQFNLAKLSLLTDIRVQS